MRDLLRKRPRVLDARAASLTPEERLVVERIDGSLSVTDLVRVTGLEAARVEQIVSKLALQGAVSLADEPMAPAAALTVDDGGTTSMAELAAALGMDPRPFAEPPAPEPAAEPAPEPERDPEPDSDSEVSDASARAANERNYRKVYETRWHALPVDQRVIGARAARGADLLALCFDADPRVIAAILENPTCGLDHVRLIAFYHRTGTGLEIVARRQDWLRDAFVERRLLRNPMIGDVVLGRVMGPKRLFPTYKIAIDRDVPDLTRGKCRGLIRKKWQTAPPDERADLLRRTDGRCLTYMTGCTFDAKTTGILCGRPIHSVMFAQSVAKFGASPPALLAHLMRQPFVRKNAPLKKMLLAHPNMPGDVKRSL